MDSHIWSESDTDIRFSITLDGFNHPQILVEFGMVERDEFKRRGNEYFYLSQSAMNEMMDFWHTNVE